jgi:Mg-chelatase subunit ChlD
MFREKKSEERVAKDQKNKRKKNEKKKGKKKRKERNTTAGREIKGEREEKKKFGIATLTNTFAPLLLAKAYLLQLRVFNAHQTYV